MYQFGVCCLLSCIFEQTEGRISQRRILRIGRNRGVQARIFTTRHVVSNHNSTSAFIRADRLCTKGCDIREPYGILLCWGIWLTCFLLFRYAVHERVPVRLVCSTISDLCSCLPYPSCAGFRLVHHLRSGTTCIRAHHQLSDCAFLVGFPLQLAGM